MKHCKKCNTTKPLAEFNKCSARKDGLQSQCRECNKRNLKGHYADNKSQYLARNKKNNDDPNGRVATIRGLVKTYKESTPCKDCGNYYPSVCMDFDHLDPSVKEKALARMVGDRASLARVEAEMQKCELVCAVCHRIRTAKRAGLL